MWPYNDDEAVWLTPPRSEPRPARPTANDNDPARPIRKSERETVPPRQGTEA